MFLFSSAKSQEEDATVVSDDAAPGDAHSSSNSGAPMDMMACKLAVVQENENCWRGELLLAANEWHGRKGAHLRNLRQVLRCNRR